MKTRREIVRELQSIAVEARRIGDHQHWIEARQMWLRYATDAEQRKAPVALSLPWTAPNQNSQTDRSLRQRLG